MDIFFDSSSWVFAREFLMRGEPPLFIQLLILNTVVLIILIFRRARGAKAMRQSTVNTVQVLMIVANCAILLNGDYRLLDMSRFWQIFS